MEKRYYKSLSERHIRGILEEFGLNDSVGRKASKHKIKNIPKGMHGMMDRVMLGLKEKAVKACGIFNAKKIKTFFLFKLIIHSTTTLSRLDNRINQLFY